MIEVNNLIKNFGNFRALDGVNMCVGTGDIYGLVGPNGAGKSTLIRHLTGVYRQDAGEIYIAGEPVYENRLVLVDGENVLLDYAKIHPFSYSGEDKVYRAGEKLVQAQVKDIRIGGYICYDLRFPEIFSAMRDQYEVIMVIANWPETRAEQWETLLKARAIENQAYVIAVNRVGDGDGLHYIPGSHVYDWLGRDVSIRVSEKLRVADIDPGAVRHARTEFPQTNDRKNTFYKMIY